MLRFETLAHPDTSVIQAILSSTNATKTSLFSSMVTPSLMNANTVKQVNLRHILMVRVGNSYIEFL